jgi:hypothetical protein
VNVIARLSGADELSLVIRRRMTLTRLAGGLGVTICLAVPHKAVAQSGGAAGWNDARTRALVERATRRRAEQLADTGLVDYRANARGYVVFLAQMGDGFLETPRLVKTDQLALEVYWRAPNQSKQRIIGRRDTTLFPTDIQYHRDHLGIVQNNFPDFIRIGEGDEVRDVPHPLSTAGLRLYDFAVTDSVRIRAGNGFINLIEVKVRPKDDRDPRVVGAVYLEPDGAQVVRMAFNFTRAAFLDDHLEDLAVVLENRLVAGRFWLPNTQQIEIRRTGTYLDFPVRGIIRGRWEVGDYQFNLALTPQIFTGPEIVVAPSAVLEQYRWETPIMEALPPDVRATVEPDIKRIQEEARVLVRARALERVTPFRISARRVSDFVRVNRVEGLSFGAGVNLRLGSRVFLGARGRVGTDDKHQGKGYGTLRWEQPSGTKLELLAGRDLADIGEMPERSTIINSIGAQEFASDMSDPYSFEQRGARLTKRFGGMDVSLYGAREQHKQLETRGIAATRVFEFTPRIVQAVGMRGGLGIERALTPWVGPGRLGMSLKASAFRTIEPPRFSELLAAGFTTYRGSIGLENRTDVGRTTLVIRENAAMILGDTILLQDGVYFGGPTSLPGYSLHDVAGRLGSATRLELQIPIPSVSIPLGRFGRVPGEAKLAPYVVGAVVRGHLPCSAGVRLATGSPANRCPQLESGFYPAVGVAALSFFDLLRLDVARGLKDGRWTFNIDVNRDFWSIL